MNFEVYKRDLCYCEPGGQHEFSHADSTTDSHLSFLLGLREGEFPLDLTVCTVQPTESFESCLYIHMYLRMTTGD